MANTLLTNDIITKEFAYQFNNSLALAKHANRTYEKDFDTSTGNTIRIRTPTRLVAGDGPSVVAQDYAQRSESLAVINQANTAVQYTSQELTLDLDNFSKNIITPAAKALANKVNTKLWEACLDTFAFSGSAASPINALSRINEGMSLMRRYSMPMDRVYSTLSIQDYEGLTNSLQPGFNQYAGGPATKDGMLPRLLNGAYLCDPDQSAITHTAGTGTAPTESPVVNGAGQSGSVLNINGLTPGVTFVKGDIFTIDGVIAVNRLTYESAGVLHKFTVTEDATADGTGAVSLNITRPIEDATSGAAPSLQTVVALPANGAALTFIGNHQVNMLFDQSALTLAVIPMYRPPEGAAHSYVMNDPDIKTSFRITQSYDFDNDINKMRFDTFFGVHCFNEAAVRLISEVPPQI